MAYINSQGYAERRVPSSKNKKLCSSKRNWWFVKDDGRGCGIIFIGNIRFKRELLGKRIRLKLEVVESDTHNHNQPKL